MEKIKGELAKWGAENENFALPRWDQLPDLELYLDQVIKLIDQYLSSVVRIEKHSLLTKSMVNNYVKLGMIPAPEKKRYNRTHVAFLIAITMLKQILTIPEIKEAIIFQGKAIGIREAYNLFCEEQENAIYTVCRQAQGKQTEKNVGEIPVAFIAAKSATAAFANKMLAEKVIELEIAYLKRQGEKNE